MAIPDLHLFLRDYFTYHNCPILSDADGILKVQLTKDMDKVLMNRPFYWHYMEKMGQEGSPMTLTLITNPSRRKEKGEWIHFGSPRLQQILRHLKEHERFIKLFQKVHVTNQTPLYPWLVVNMKISYIGKQKKDKIISIGLHLVNGSMRFSMMDYLKNFSLETTISDYCYTISPLIRIKSGFGRIENIIFQHIEKEKQEWAVESIRTLKEEIEMLEHFYKEEEDEERKQNEVEEIKERYQPVIKISVINGGLIYLTE